MTDFDAIIAGGGPAGLAAAALLAQGGMCTGLASGKNAAESDPRTVALMLPAIRLLEHLGVWPGRLSADAAPLRKMRLVDDTGSAIPSPTLLFAAEELGIDAFGWNIPLARLVAALRARAIEVGARVIENEVTGAEIDAGLIVVNMTNGPPLSARVALAADGRDSRLREAAGIHIDEWSYDQVAIATSFSHSAPHYDISTEHHRPGGPCTTVPLPGNRSSLVWMEHSARASQLMALDDASLAAEIQIAVHGNLGLVADLGARGSFPMRGLMAKRFASNRILLVGEAAHVVPPLGAQGVNMGLADAAIASELILAGADPGGRDVTESYDRRRRLDVGPRQRAIDLVNRSLLSNLLVVQGMRAAALAMLRSFAPLQRTMMRRAMGPELRFPQADRGPLPSGHRLGNQMP
jgi:2-octaprenyl-6-methoxyphenol hydroxylase